MAEGKTIWSVGGGKGGIGKSITAANIACALARRAERVVLVDADLGGANLHTYFGIKFPEKGLGDLLKGRVQTLEDAAIETPVKGLRLISGAGEFLGIANPAYHQKQKIISHIKKLDARYIIVDLGAGTSFNVLDFFAVSSEGIVVIVPEPAAIQNAYIFLKSFVYRVLSRVFAEDAAVSEIIKEAADPGRAGGVKTFADLCERIARQDSEAADKALAAVKAYRPKLILNMAVSSEDNKAVEAFKAAASSFLGLDTEYIGTIYSRPSIKAAARNMRPFMLDKDASDAHKDIEGITARLAGASAETMAQQARQAPLGVAPAREAFGFNDNVNQSGTVYHIQTEAKGGTDPSIETVIYNGGRIVFSKKLFLKDIAQERGGGDIREAASKQHRAAMAAVSKNKITFHG